MKIAFYNIQNIFHRHIDLVDRYRDENRSRWIAEFETLLTQPERTPKQYDRMRMLSRLLEFDNQGQMPYFTVKNTMGQLRIRKGLDGEMSKASHLTDWEGWAKVDSLPIHEIAVRNKAKVINAIDPDILVLSEIEDRHSLLEFNRHFISSEGKTTFKELVFLGTNDPWGRGIGVLAKTGFNLISIKTHVNELDEANKPLFDVDLQEYVFRTDSGLNLVALCTHFLGSGNEMEPFRKRQKLQAGHIARLVAQRQKSSEANMVLMGTLNAPSYSSCIAPLTQDAELSDITKHPRFWCTLDKGQDADYFRMGAFKKGVNIPQRDYLMLSKNLFAAIENCGLVRKGVCYKKRPKWDVFGSVENEVYAASEHPLLWSQIRL
ncbi:hypothetical protein [Allomuricauda sp. F6463D]|uniref:hypothetical protein n=1 Tax=Allomuricauda sp. F6463D TaxID=2926409 RepID=UPI001FF1C01C|nr:hypothetical protein [Muricauda sp. F6463D]MCK0160475.1 hypothetical protein [Muricauda sp. F6463D]